MNKIFNPIQLIKIIEGRDPGDEDDGGSLIDGIPKSVRNVERLADLPPPCAVSNYVGSKIADAMLAADHDTAEG